ncbi:Carboxylesterase [Trichoderma sp. SZMC 28011]
MLHSTSLASLLLLADLISAASHPQDPPTVHLSSGTILGNTCKHTPVKQFQGIPYAHPPVGHRRFMPPELFNGRYPNGHLDATKPPPACIQWGSAFDVTDTPLSEDCLYLDVYVPQHATSKSSLPVKVFAYGGGNDGGAITYPLYDSCNLATDAIVVKFNYRLGPLGFLALPGAGIRGNMAIQDYLAALTWVKHNIKAFGGDSAKVMLFGQSAGADDTFVVSTLPEAKHLISAAVMESGGGQDVAPYKTATYTGQSFAKTLNCRSDDLCCLQSKSVKQLIQAHSQTPALIDPTTNGGLLATVLGIDLPNITSLDSSVLDGEIIKHQPLSVGSQVPIIIGQNELDSSLLTLPVYFSSSSNVLTESNYTDFLSQWGPSSSSISKTYPLSLFNTTGSTSFAVVAAITHITTVSSFICPGYKALRAAKAPAYAYRFNRTLSCPWLDEDGQPFPSADLASFFGSTHTAELPFVFGNMDNQPFGNGTCNASKQDRRISASMIGAWTALAERGNPETKSVKWPRFDAHANRGVYIQDSITPAELDFSECEFWDQIWAAMGGVNFTATA